VDVVALCGMRAYLDFGRGQVTDLFTHWIDVVLVYGQDKPIAASAIAGVYTYKDARTAPGTINVLLEYPSQFTATFEATLVPGIKGESIEFAGLEGRLLIDRADYEFHSTEKGAPLVVKASTNLDSIISRTFWSVSARARYRMAMCSSGAVPRKRRTG
jgi:predicted dehydrogenase